MQGKVHQILPMQSLGCSADYRQGPTQTQTLPGPPQESFLSPLSPQANFGGSKLLSYRPHVYLPLWGHLCPHSAAPDFSPSPKPLVSA